VRFAKGGRLQVYGCLSVRTSFGILSKAQVAFGESMPYCSLSFRSALQFLNRNCGAIENCSQQNVSVRLYVRIGELEKIMVYEIRDSARI